MLFVWGVLAPLGDVVIYQEAAEKVFAQGIVAGIANAVTVAYRRYSSLASLFTYADSFRKFEKGLT